MEPFRGNYCVHTTLSVNHVSCVKRRKACLSARERLPPFWWCQKEKAAPSTCRPEFAERRSEPALVMRLLNNSDSFIFAKGCLPGSLDLSQDLLSFSPPDVALGFEVMPGEVLHDGID